MKSVVISDVTQKTRFDEYWESQVLPFTDYFRAVWFDVGRLVGRGQVRFVAVGN
jgi:hypothetical protein